MIRTGRESKTVGGWKRNGGMWGESGGGEESQGDGKGDFEGSLEEGARIGAWKGIVGMGSWKGKEWEGSEDKRFEMFYYDILIPLQRQFYYHENILLRKSWFCKKIKDWIKLKFSRNSILWMWAFNIPRKYSGKIMV